MQRILLAALPLALVVAACSGGSGAAPDPTAGASVAAPSSTVTPSAAAPSDQPVSPTPAGPAATPEPGATAAPSAAPSTAVLTQPWATAQLTDVRTGQPFTIAGLVAQDRVVFVETMAMWCSKCFAEQQEAKAALAQLDRSKVTWVALDVESSESAEALARYADENGFDFEYAIADADLSRALAAEFGDQILNPPSVNVIVIGPDGSVAASTGNKSADELIALARERGA